MREIPADSISPRRLFFLALRAHRSSGGKALPVTLRCNTEAKFESPPEYVGTPKAHGRGDGIYAASSLRQSLSRLAEASRFHELRWGTAGR